MAAFTSASRPAGGLTCAADLTFTDKRRGHLSYSVFLKDSKVMVVTENLKEL